MDYKMGTSINKFAMWAEWCQNDGIKKQSNMVAKMMESAGYLTFGTAGGSCDADCIESRVEHLVYELATSKPRQAKSLRVMHGSSDWRDLKLSPIGMAKKVGVSQATFYRDVKNAEKYVNLKMGGFVKWG